MAHWTNKYFGSLYYEIYSKYLLDPQRALDEASFAAQVLDLGRRTVLDLACGYGRHARLLAASNRVYALDSNGDYVRVLREEMTPRMAASLLPLQGDMRNIPLQDRSVDAAIMLFNSFGYFGAGEAEDMPEPVQERGSGQVWKLPNIFYERQLVDPSFGRFQDPAAGDSPEGTVEIETEDSDEGAVADKENAAVLREALRVLKPGGGLLLEIPNRRLLLEAVDENPRRLMVVDEAEVHEEFGWDSRRHRLLNRTRFVSGNRSEAVSYSLRLYDPAEIKQLVSDAGYKIQRTFGDYEGRRFGPASSDVLLIHATRPVRTRR